MQVLTFVAVNFAFQPADRTCGAEVPGITICARQRDACRFRAFFCRHATREVRLDHLIFVLRVLETFRVRVGDSNRASVIPDFGFLLYGSQGVHGRVVKRAVSGLEPGCGVKHIEDLVGFAVVNDLCAYLDVETLSHQSPRRVDHDLRGVVGLLIGGLRGLRRERREEKGEDGNEGSRHDVVAGGFQNRRRK